MIALIIALMFLFLAGGWFLRYVVAGPVGMDHAIVFRGTNPVTATLPDARRCEGRLYSISNTNNAFPTPTLTIAPKKLQKIDGESIYSLPQAGQSILLMSDGANWRILTEFIPSSGHSPKVGDVSVSYVNASNEMHRAANFYNISVN